jgi:hypothetical protein
MVGINGTGGIGVEATRRTVTIRPRADAAAWPGIAETAAEPGASREAGGAAPALALDSLLALQESMGEAVPDALERDRPAREHGRRLLAALNGLQRMVLGDGSSGLVLDQLRSLADIDPATADPALAATLGAIRLRVRVELARRGF